MNRVLAIMGGLMAATAIAVSGCDDDSSEEASGDFCSDLNALGDALDAYAALTASSTFDEVEDAQAEVADAYEAVQDSAADVTEARLADLEAAIEELDAAVDDLSGEDTVGEAITTVASQAQQVRAARDDLASSVNCP